VRPRPNLSEIVRRIWWRPAFSQFELTYEYYRLARLLMPQKYRKQVGFGPAWLVHVDPAAALPQFTAGRLLSSPPGVDLGPFATQADAGRFIDILHDAFDLCRYHHILEQAPHGQACAYFEMGKCPAPCDGSIPLAQYRRMIAAALRFACGDHGPVYETIGAHMREAAGAQQYERAGALKKQLERARGIEHAAFARVAPLDDFNYLILQRGPGTTRIKPFFVRQGTIEPGPHVMRSEAGTTLKSWSDEMIREPDRLDPEQRSEHVWLVSHFLFKPDRPGLYLHASELADHDHLRAMIDQAFPRRRGSGQTPADPVESENPQSEIPNHESPT
jgi:hypothetical protein